MPVKNKILLFTDWYEPGFKAGGPIQACRNIVNTLSDQFDFWIFTSDRDLGDNQPYKNMPTDCWIKLPYGAHIWYASPESSKSSIIRKIIEDIKPQIVYLNSMFSAGFSLLPLWILRNMKFNGRIILAPRGMLNTSAVSRKKWKKKVFLTLFSLTRISKKIIFHATDIQEENDIKKYFKQNTAVHMIGDIPGVCENWKARNKQPGQVNCVFISRIHPIKNLLFAIEVVKRVGGCSMIFDIYGPVEDQKYFQKCREAAAGASPHIHINFKDPVANSNIFSVLQNYHLFFLPTQGENFGHVIYEALTSGCPVLISDKTPWKNIDEKNAGWAVPLNDNRKFAQKIKEVCLMNEEDFNERSKAAFQFAKEYMDSMNLKSRYTTLFKTSD